MQGLWEQGRGSPEALVAFREVPSRWRHGSREQHSTAQRLVCLPQACRAAPLSLLTPFLPLTPSLPQAQGVTEREEAPGSGLSAAHLPAHLPAVEVLLFLVTQPAGLVSRLQSCRWQKCRLFPRLACAWPRLSGGRWQSLFPLPCPSHMWPWDLGLWPAPQFRPGLSGGAGLRWLLPQLRGDLGQAWRSWRWEVSVWRRAQLPDRRSFSLVFRVLTLLFRVWSVTLWASLCLWRLSSARLGMAFFCCFSHFGPFWRPRCRVWI